MIRFLPLLLLLWAAPAWASWTFVGCTDNGNNKTVTRSVTAGDLLIVGAWTGTPSDSFTIDSGFTQIGSQCNDAGLNNSAIWWYRSAASTGSLTVTTTSSGTSEGIFMCEWSSTAGAVPSAALEASAQTATPGTGTTVANATTSGSAGPPASNGDLLVSMVGDVVAGATTYTAGSSPNAFTREFVASLDTITANIEDFTQSTAAAAAGTWTSPNTNAYCAFVGFFKEAGAGGATLPPQRTQTGVGL